ncbi:UNVERIFIED_CONTAM: hypothetical protein PYX00_006354 [Menopon gallinae]|uniref:Uncharacterized protein n=1 Tax=Menopon gallinae TaxID=328185 RepID=A0AAW2HV21_9NEOP
MNISSQIVITQEKDEHHFHAANARGYTDETETDEHSCTYNLSYCSALCLFSSNIVRTEYKEEEHLVPADTKE